MSLSPEKTMAIATPMISDYETWKPQGEKILDLRLATFGNEERENNLVVQSAKAMGPALEALYTQASYISKNAFEEFLPHCPNIKAISLSCAYRIDDEVLKCIGQHCPRLEELNLSLARNQRIIHVVGGIFVHPNTPEEDALTTHVTDVGIAHILNGCSQLRALDIGQTDASEESLKLIAQKKNIQVLRTGPLSKISKEALANLQAMRPDLQILPCNACASDDGASCAFTELSKRVAKRYYQKIPLEHGGFRAVIKDDIPPHQARLVYPGIFVNLH